jgi:flagellar protein FlgJ
MKTLPLSQLPPKAEASVPPEVDAKLHAVAKQFEGIFMNQLVSEMRKTVTRSGLIPESHAEKVYQGMLDGEYATKVADSAQLGLAKMIYQQLLRSSGPR